MLCGFKILQDFCCKSVRMLAGYSMQYAEACTIKQLTQFSLTPMLLMLYLRAFETYIFLYACKKTSRDFSFF